MARITVLRRRWQLRLHRVDGEPYCAEQDARDDAKNELLHDCSSDQNPNSTRSGDSGRPNPNPDPDPALAQHDLPHGSKSEAGGCQHREARCQPCRQRAPQQLHASMQAHLHGAKRDIEACRDLLLLEAVHKPQRQDLSVVSRQPFDGGMNRFDALVRLCQEARRLVDAPREALRIRHALTLSSRFPHMIAQDTNQPRRQRSCRVPAIALVNGVEKRGLNQIFGHRTAR